jgi:hypothetical protein
MKLMIGVILMAGAFLSDPPKALGMLGPQAQVMGWKIKYDVQRALPWVTRLNRR